jgi:hypothetical protein
MDLSGLHLFDPILIDSVRHTVAAAQDQIAGALHAVAPGWAPDGGDFGGEPGDGGRIETVEAPAEKPAENPSTVPPDKKVVEGSLEKKDTPGAGGPTSTVDFSIWGIISRADPIAKAVIAILSVASVWSWAIIFEKIIALRSVNARSDGFENRFWSGGSVDSPRSARRRRSSGCSARCGAS